MIVTRRRHDLVMKLFDTIMSAYVVGAALSVVGLRRTALVVAFVGAALTLGSIAVAPEAYMDSGHMWANQRLVPVLNAGADRLSRLLLEQPG